MTELIAFLGGGQMAGAMIGGPCAAGHQAARIRVAEPDAARAGALRQTYGVDIAAGGALARDADALVLAVKPQVLPQALQGVKPAAATVVVSIAAGVRVASLRRMVGDGPAIVRCMPNTPAQLRSGVTALFAPDGTAPVARQLAERILASVGATCWLRDETLMDAVTALSGSGPAYYFLLTEALQEAGQALGLDAAVARLLAERTLAGAGRMAESAGKDMKELRANVTSKGGTTEAALAHLEKHGVRQLIAGALQAAAARGRELGDAFESSVRGGSL